MENLNLGALKRSSNSDMLAKLKQDVAAATTKKSFKKDERFWKPTVDSSGSGYGVIRFLPAKTNNSLPFVQTYSHSFQDVGGWFIEPCPATIGEPCFCCETGKTLYYTGTEENKKLASKYNKKLSYIANVLIVKDPANPENEGQVRLFSFGKKIMDKINVAMSGRPELGIEPTGVFSFFDSTNFNLVQVKQHDFPNYDQSTFVAAKDLYDGDEKKLLEVITKMYDLSEFVAPTLFKPYEESKERFLKVTGAAGGVVHQAKVAVVDESFEQVVQKPQATQHHAEPSGEVDDDLAFFQSLASK